MKLANIYPIKNQNLYSNEDCVMILAHLLSNYNPKFFNNNQFIILDNGLYEGSQISTNLEDLISLAKKSEIPIKEIVIPDKFFDAKETINLLEKNLPIIEKYKNEYSFMFVAQSNNIKEFAEVMDYIEKYKNLPLTIGIPKKAPFTRECDEACNIYKRCSFPIHFLGLTDNTPLINLYKVKDIIRSCDTSQIVTMLKNNKKDILTYTRSKKDSIIDLLNDFIDENDIKEVLCKINNFQNINYDITFIGSGPSTIFAILELIKNKYKGKILILDKGKSLDSRQPNEVINGFAGAGCFSDSKLSSALDVGGTIPNLTENELNKYENIILETLNYFKINSPNIEDKTNLKWDIIKEFDTKKTSLNWNMHKTCHIGTEIGRAIYKEIEYFIKKQPNIEIKFESEVEDVDKINNLYKIYFKNNNYLPIYSTKLILATGQKDQLPSKLINKFKLKNKPRAFQLGIRVEDIMNQQYEEIIKANYDFKFVKNYNYGDINIRVRTFCCNSGNAHTCAEVTNNNFTCFNGHSFKFKDDTNNTVNYGIMCEIEGLPKYDSKEQQIKLMQDINNISTWKEDNFDTYGKVKPKRKLLDGFSHLINYYPKEVLYSLYDFVKELNKIVDLKEAYYLYPEVKLSGLIPNLNYNTFETEENNLYMIGDCAVSRGITKAAITGLKLAANILKN